MHTLIEFDIREHAACHSNGSNACFPKPILNKLNTNLFQEKLNTGSQIGFVEVFREAAADLLQRRAVVHRHRVLNLSRLSIAHKFAQHADISWFSKSSQTGYLAFMTLGFEAAQMGDVGIKISQRIETVHRGKTG